MKIKALRRNYDKLTDLERFRAALAAWERGDEEEFRALRSTAPKANYRMTAWPYGGMGDAIRDITWLVVTDILNRGLLMYVVWAKHVRQSEVWKEAYDRGENYEPGEDYEPDLRRLGLEAVEGLLAMWAGLGLFCEELGITVEQALAYAPPASALTFIRDLCIDLRALEDKRLGEENRAEQRAERARGIADELKQIWEKAVNG